MRIFLSKYRYSKFRRFLNGLAYAIVSVVAMFTCVYFLMDKTATRFEILIPFGLSIISMLFGFVSLFRNQNI
jgi:uncharacterized membrane protein YbhN (UPF0104 family)